MSVLRWQSRNRVIESLRNWDIQRLLRTWQLMRNPSAH